jgi:large subunit ribosomal protein L17
MRHKKKGNHLSRTYSHKKALMKNMSAQVIEHKEIKTTLAKAKELRRYVERLITYAKKGSLHHRRLAFKFLQNKNAVTSLFDEIAQEFETRNGGYSRIVKLGLRKGDGASMALFQLVGFEKGTAKGVAPATVSPEKTVAPKDEPEVEKVEEETETTDEPKEQQ